MFRSLDDCCCHKQPGGRHGEHNHWTFSLYISDNIQNNVERIKHYDELESEAAKTVPADAPPSWPSKGQVTFSQVCLRYQPDLPMILQQVSFSVNPGEKVGVIGRTGAGKSSLAQALFRTVNICSGSISVDGVNLAIIGLDTVSHLPQ